MMDKLVIIGANDFQNQLIIKANSMGLETHVFAWEEDAVGKKNADYFYPISITEKEKILKKCEEIKPIGIASIASDLASITVNYLAEKLGLVGNGIKSSLLSTNKYLMRKAFEQRKDPSPKSYRLDELNEEIIKKLQFPVIVKPVDRSGSRGITKIERKEDLPKAIKAAQDVSFAKQILIEEFAQGDEYSVEYVSYKGEHHFLALTKKLTTGAPHFIETGHIQPALISDDLLEKIKKIIEHALDSLSIQYGASHSEIKVDCEGNIKIIEIGGRMGGDCIGSDLVYLSTGYDFLKMVIEIACGKEPNMVPTGDKHSVQIRFLFNQEDLDRLEQIKRNTPHSIYRISDIKYENIGNDIVDSATRLGYYILVTDSDVGRNI